jgi:ATP synthase F1 gamma subunit
MALALRRVGPLFSRTPTQLTPQATPYSAQWGAVRHGSNLKDVRTRIKSVKAIQKITKTMKMIASSRLREAQRRVDVVKGFAAGSNKPFEETTPVVEVKERTRESKELHPVVAGAKTHLLVTVCSDRGLCGAINSSSAKLTKTLVREREAQGGKTQLMLIGDKATAQLQREYGDRVLFSAGDTTKRPINFLGIGMLLDRALHQSKQQFDNVSVIFNHFNSIISYTTMHRDLGSFAKLLEKPEAFDAYEFEEDAHQVHLQDLYEFRLGSFLLNAIVENQAAELGARMSSMDNATRNAGEMLKKLNITYNRRRQAAITTELTEIISGAAALE